MAVSKDSTLFPGPTARESIVAFAGVFLLISSVSLSQDRPGSDAVPFPPARSFRVERGDDGQRVLWRGDQVVLKAGEFDFASYEYAGVVVAGGKRHRIGRSVRISQNGISVPAEDIRLRGSVEWFADLIHFEKSERHGIVTTDGKVIGKAEYDDLFILGAKYILVEKDEWEGAVDFRLKPVLPFKYRDLSYLGNDRCSGELEPGGKAGVIDTNGKVIVDFVHEAVFANYIDGVHLFGSPRGNLAGVLNAKGEVVYEPRFKVTRRPDKSNGLIFVTDTKTGKRGVINSQCRFISDDAIKELFGMWQLDPDRSDRKALVKLTNQFLDELEERRPKNLPPLKRPSLEGFQMTLRLDASGGATQMGEFYSGLKWSPINGALELRLNGPLRGLAKVHLDGKFLVYQQTENYNKAKRKIDGSPVPAKPLYFVRMSPPKRAGKD